MDLGPALDPRLDGRLVLKILLPGHHKAPALVMGRPRSQA